MSLRSWLMRLVAPRRARLEELADAPVRVPRVSLVDGAQPLRDALVYLEMELEGDVTDGPTITGGGFYARASATSVGVGYVGPSETGQERELRATELQDRFLGVWQAWQELEPTTRQALSERGLDVEFVVNIRETPIPKSQDQYAPLRAQVGRAIATFCDFDYEGDRPT